MNRPVPGSEHRVRAGGSSDQALDGSVVLGYANIGLNVRRRLPGWLWDYVAGLAAGPGVARGQAAR